MQRKYSVAKIELRAIVKTLKEFKRDTMGPTYKCLLTTKKKISYKML